MLTVIYFVGKKDNTNYRIEIFCKLTNKDGLLFMLAEYIVIAGN